MSETNEVRLWKFVADTLSAGGRIALMAVTAEEKGSPGKTGFKMALSADGTSSGTIGGGIMEHRLKEEYGPRLQRNEHLCHVRLLVHSQETRRGEPSGLTCAGSQTVCVLSLGAGEAAVVGSILQALSDRTAGHVTMSERGLSFHAGSVSVGAAFVQPSPASWTYTENIGPELTVFIIGGGHVGHALSRILSTLSMSVIVYDEREDMPMFRDNPYADKTIADSYSNIASYVTAPEKTFAAVVTSDFSTDAVAVKALLPLGLPYLGIMGVEAKMARIKNTLTDEERAMYDAQAVHAPIGLRIGSGTAEEIAVSIAGEMIAVKNRLAR